MSSVAILHLPLKATRKTEGHAAINFSGVSVGLLGLKGAPWIQLKAEICLREHVVCLFGGNAKWADDKWAISNTPVPRQHI